MALDRATARKNKANAIAKFNRLAALRSAGNHTGCTRMSDSWGKRNSSNIQGFYNAKEAKK